MLDSMGFGEFLKRQREIHKIGRELLGKGIFTDNMMGKIERGDRYPEKQIRDRLLERLGESGYDYENFVQPEEYDAWVERRNILDALDDGVLEKAEQLLTEYAKNNDMNNKVIRQFWLAMKLQWMELCGASQEERFTIINEAVKLTVPGVDKLPISQMVLAVQEWNLVLEYVTYKQQNNLEDVYRELLQVIEQGSFDSMNKAMLGAKTTLYYCRYRNRVDASGQKQLEQAEYIKQSLKLCTQAIEWLRDRNKIYFAWELLQLKEQYLLWLMNHRDLFSKDQLSNYEKELQQTKKFYALLDGLYEEFGVQKQTNLFTFFYREYEVYCINDVILARMQMLHITAEDMEQELVCSQSTIKRLKENKNINKANAQRLFARMYLSMEMTRAQLVTNNQEVIRLEERYRETFGQREYETTKEILLQIKDLVSMDEMINRQYIEYGEWELEYKLGNISKEEFVQHAKSVLEYTVPYEAAMAEFKDVKLKNGRIRKGRKYLTNQEVTILYNIINTFGTDVENELWNVLQEYFEWLEKKSTLAPILGMYGFVMETIASYKGNIGLYRESSAINRRIITASLRAKSLSYMHRDLYGLHWNYFKQKGLPMEPEDPKWRQGLLRCLTVDMYCKDEWRAKGMRRRLKMDESL